MKLKTNILKAFTLIEVLLVIGFIALAAAGVYVTYSKADVASKSHNEATYINTIAAGTRKLYTGAVYPGAAASTVLMNSTLIKAKVIPDKFVIDPTGVITTVFNNFGGNIVINAVDVGATRGFEIGTSSLPPDVCAQLASELQLSFNIVKIGTTLVTAASATPTKSDSINFTPVAATTACSNASNAIIFQGR